jgi:Vanillate O-demethylase oxygenase C-terminal domain
VPVPAAQQDRPCGRAAPADGSPDDQAFHVEVGYALTPETQTSTHDFWLVARDFALDDEWVTGYLRENNREVVMQDVVALNLLEELIAADGDAYQELSISIDAGGLAARRLIKRLLEAQELQAR